MNYAGIMERAWKIIWKHKVLWIFGILAGCGRNAPSSPGDGNSAENAPSAFEGMTDLPFFQGSGIPIENQFVIFVSVGLLILLLLMFLFAFLNTMGKIGLIRGVVRAENNPAPMIFSELWQTRYFWRLFGLNLMVGLAALLIFLVSLAPFALFFFSAAQNQGGSQEALAGAIISFFACLCSLICLVGLAAAAAGIWVEQVQNAVVLEDLSLREGMRKGWIIFRNNLGSLIILGLILGILSMGFGFVAMAPLVAVMLPLLIAAVGAGMGSQAVTVGGYITAGLCVATYLPLYLAVYGAVTAFSSACWTLVYRDLAPRPIDPNLPSPLEPVSFTIGDDAVQAAPSPKL